ncbi:50S ribosomal protein L32 [Actinocatenispora comari]|jgi:large subunit ribosomal protein L32|uniref:Large ribosomal subunit protein bL32 n=1 Tax=Actinocatenispora comari TaxID=2807577 RepID=A0A8J4A6U9_9ACTN|nr:50S ribosomal protein L32 [Actinocatenispora comari]GIL25363.1 hypothetical protein NUM_06180 [Actinocatenispora comari]
MAVPKRRTSRSRTRSRRAHWLRATVPALTPVIIGGERRLVPRRLARHHQRSTDT